MNHMYIAIATLKVFVALYANIRFTFTFEVNKHFTPPTYVEPADCTLRNSNITSSNASILPTLYICGYTCSSQHCLSFLFLFSHTSLSACLSVTRCCALS